jgi:hypothetical protein
MRGREVRWGGVRHAAAGRGMRGRVDGWHRQSDGGDGGGGMVVPSLHYRLKESGVI